MSTFALKLTALICMLLDHIGFLTGSMFLRCVGRLSFPIFAFLIARGFEHTRDAKRYMLRLLLFSALSEVPFDLFVSGSFWYPDAQNVFFTLSLGLLAITLYDFWARRGRAKAGLMFLPALGILAEVLRCDYGAAGVFLIFICYICRDRAVFSGWFLFGCVFLSLTSLFQGDLVWVLIELLSVAALPLLLSYKEGPSPRLKYFFYAFYPAHLLVLYFLHQAGLIGI